MVCTAAYAGASTESVSVQRSSRPRRAMAGSDTSRDSQERSFWAALQDTQGIGALEEKKEGMVQAHETKTVRSYDAES